MRALAVIAMCVLTASAAPTRGRVEQIDHRYPDGRLESRRFYADGKKVGRHEAWWPNGQLRSSAMYLDDAYHGEYRTWRENGHPYEVRHFDRGRESGLQQSWNDDGSLYLNYEVRNGRRYGFINAKPCLAAGPDGTSQVVREP